MAFHKKALSRYRSRRHDRQFRAATVLDEQAAGRAIQQRILAGNPLMVSRFSTCEINVLNAYRQRQRRGLSRRIHGLLENVPTDYTETIRFQARNNAGIFPETDEGLDSFSIITLHACSQIDLLGIWGRPLRLEETLQKERCPAARLLPLHAIDPYDKEVPWTAALQGKKVLVVHPFEKSIQAQYPRREQLFPGRQVLPEFELKTVKAVQSAAGSAVEFSRWPDALAAMEEQMAAIDFDVALIGAGAYGLPLAAHVKTLGRQAIHMGGMLQLLFGIKGARWDDRPDISSLYNENWVRPLPEETPAQSGRIEEGCYW